MKDEKVLKVNKPENEKKSPEEIEVLNRKRARRMEEILEERELSLEEEEKVIVEWSAPVRAYKERTREFYTTIAAIVFLLSVILFFAQEFLLIGVVLAMAFAAYVFASVKPEDTTHQITTRGIRSGGRFFRWSELGRFWFMDRFGQRMVMIETMIPFPRVVVMLLSEMSEDKLKDILRKYVLHETPEPGFWDKASVWLAKKVPLEE